MSCSPSLTQKWCDMLRQLSLLLVLWWWFLLAARRLPRFRNSQVTRNVTESDKRLVINDLSEDDLRDLEADLYLQAQSGLDRETPSRFRSSPRPAVRKSVCMTKRRSLLRNRTASWP